MCVRVWLRAGMRAHMSMRARAPARMPVRRRMRMRFRLCMCVCLFVYACACACACSFMHVRVRVLDRIRVPVCMRAIARACLHACDRFLFPDPRRVFFVQSIVAVAHNQLPIYGYSPWLIACQS